MSRGSTPAPPSHSRTTSTSAPAPRSGAWMLTRSAEGSTSASGADRISLSTRRVVVGQKRAGGIDDRSRAAVVDLERVLRRAREVAAVVDEEPGVGARVTVDDLIVVAHAEHVVARAPTSSRRSNTWAGVRSCSSSTSRWRCSACRSRRNAPSLEQQLDGQVDLLVVVDHLPAAQLGPVRIERGGQTFGAVELEPRPRPGRAGRGG